MSSKYEDNKYRDIGTQGNYRNQTRKQLQDSQPDFFGFVIGFQKFLILKCLRVKEANKSRAEDTFVDDSVEPVNRFLRGFKENTNFWKDKSKYSTDNRENGENCQGEFPVNHEKKRARSDDKKRWGYDGSNRLWNKSFYRIDIRSDIGQKFWRSDVLDIVIILPWYFLYDLQP